MIDLERVEKFISATCSLPLEDLIRCGMLLPVWV